MGKAELKADIETLESLASDIETDISEMQVGLESYQRHLTAVTAELSSKKQDLNSLLPT